MPCLLEAVGAGGDAVWRRQGLVPLPHPLPVSGSRVLVSLRLSAVWGTAAACFWLRKCGGRQRAVGGGKASWRTDKKMIMGLDTKGTSIMPQALNQNSIRLTAREDQVRVTYQGANGYPSGYSLTLSSTTK